MFMYSKYLRNNKNINCTIKIILTLKHYCNTHTNLLVWLGDEIQRFHNIFKQCVWNEPIIWRWGEKKRGRWLELLSLDQHLHHWCLMPNIKHEFHLLIEAILQTTHTNVHKHVKTMADKWMDEWCMLFFLLSGLQVSDRMFAEQLVC